MKKSILLFILSFFIVLTAKAGFDDLTLPPDVGGPLGYYALYKTTTNGTIVFHPIGITNTRGECISQLNQGLMLPNAELVKPCKKILRSH